MADQSQFSNFSKEDLLIIVEKLISEGFDDSNPYDYGHEKKHDIVSSIGGFFNMEVVDEDVEFFTKLIEINKNIISEILKTKNKSLIQKIVIPVAKKYNVNYEEWGSCTYTTEYQTTWTSYDKDWVTESMSKAREYGYWDFYDGKTIDTIYDNYNSSDHEFKDVIEINNIEESFNRNKIIESLDKKTLLELRGLIDNKLKRL